MRRGRRVWRRRWRPTARRWRCIPATGCLLQWATTQNNLGTALWTLGEREEGPARLEEAAAAFRAALEVLELAAAGYYLQIVCENLARVEALIAERHPAPGC